MSALLFPPPVKQSQVMAYPNIIGIEVTELVEYVLFIAPDEKPVVYLTHAKLVHHDQFYIGTYPISVEKPLPAGMLHQRPRSGTFFTYRWSHMQVPCVIFSLGDRSAWDADCDVLSQTFLDHKHE